MKVGLTITGLAVGWVAIAVFGRTSTAGPPPWLPYAVLGWFMVTAVVVIRALVVAARKDDGTAEKPTQGPIDYARRAPAPAKGEPPSQV
jgi:hypothetical protein